MTTFTTFRFGCALRDGLVFSLQWRPVALWILVLALPAILGVAPLYAALAAMLDHLPDGDALARGFSLSQAGDLMAALGDSGGAIRIALLASALVALLVSPWLTGVAIGAARAQRPPTLRELVAGAFSEYPRQLRLLLWAGLVYALALGLFGLVSYWADERAQGLTLETSAQWGFHLATLVGALAFLAAHASLETARAFLVVRPSDGGALRAWWRAVKLMLRRPLQLSGLYLLVMLVALAVAAVIALVRIRIEAIGVPMFALALLLANLGVAALAWGRVARLRALAHLAQDEAARRYR